MKLKRLFIMMIVLLSSAKLLYPIPGYYIEPKFSLYPYLNRYDVRKSKNYKIAVGGGVAVGYDFSTIGSPPFRIELEWLGSIPISNPKIANNYFLFNVYYDIHFFYVRRDELEYKTTGEVYTSTPLFSLYGGLSGGLAIRTIELVAPKNSDNILTTAKTVGTSYLLGINAGFIIHATRYVGVNFGYKWVNTGFYKDGHEVLLGVRFMIPNLSADVTGMFIRE